MRFLHHHHHRLPNPIATLILIHIIGAVATRSRTPAASGRSHAPVIHLSQEDVFLPRILEESRSRRDVPQHQQGRWPDQARYAVRVGGRDAVVALRRNRELMSQDYTEFHYLADGTPVTNTTVERSHCLYQGHVEGEPGSSVSLSTCDGLRGLLRVSHGSYVVEPLPGSSSGEHTSSRVRRSAEPHATCGVADAAPSPPTSSLPPPRYRHRDASPWSPPLQPGRPRVAAMVAPVTEVQRALLSDTKYISLVIVVDNAEFIKLGRDMQRVRQRVLEITNHVDKLYRPLNIRVALVGLEVWTHEDKAPITSDPKLTLDRFLDWRFLHLVPRKRHDNTQLLTGMDFVGDTVGLAPISGMCSIRQSGAINQDHHASAVGVATTMAHEMGHNLGMTHDLAERGCVCATPEERGGCLLSPGLGSLFPLEFSSCSQGDLRNFLLTGLAECLLSPPAPGEVYGGSVCGNLFLEPGEECDCGTAEECTNPCCDPLTCRLQPGAECAHGACCDSCKVAPAGRECRPARSECDLPESCDGAAPSCPPNLRMADGTPCQGGAAFCHSGACPTPLQQCRSLWGAGADVAPAVCFERVNVQGNKYGNCGVDTHGYVACAQRDTRCGKLQCVGGEGYPITGVTYTLRVPWGAALTVCKIAGHESDRSGRPPTAGEPPAGSVLSGTKCGDDKVCVFGKCQDVSSLGADECTAKCNGHGVCNNLRRCHCEPGWEPPFCLERASGAGLPVVVVVVCAVVAAVVAVVVVAVVAAVCVRRRRRTSIGYKQHDSRSTASVAKTTVATASVTKTTTAVAISSPRFKSSTNHAAQQRLPLPAALPAPLPAPPPAAPGTVAATRALFLQSPSEAAPAPPGAPFRPRPLKSATSPTSPTSVAAPQPRPRPPVPCKPLPLLSTGIRGGGPSRPLLPPKPLMPPKVGPR
ncbi:disintegrin and metalloproteinase domain-containing protein 8-like isoform X2 [Lampetra fluviatilis]